MSGVLAKLPGIGGKNTPYLSSANFSKMRLQKLVFLFAIGCFGWLQLPAQDLHFSQFYLNPLHLTPAQTGVFQGDMRVSGIYRSQWSSVPVDYRTFGAAFDMKALRRENFTVNGGLLIQRDRAGDAGLSWTQIGLSGSVAHALGESQAVSAGFSVAGVQRGIDPDGLKFKNQWTGELFDPNLPSKENLDRSSGFAPSLAAGLNWHFEPPEAAGRTRLDIGIGASHLNRPNVSLGPDDQFKLPMRFALSAAGTFKMNDWLDAVGFAAAQKMIVNQEVIIGAGARRWLSDVPGKRTAVQFSLATRLGDALIPAIQFEQNSWTVGVSYDVNISKFDVATNGRGGLEVAAVYRVVKVPPAKSYKVCPVF